MISDHKVASLVKRSNDLRHIALELALAGGSNASHIGGALSCIDFLIVANDIYDLSANVTNMQSLILSKGHACLALYSLLIQAKLVEKNNVINTFEKDGSKYLGHPCRDPSIGITFSTGSLGNGLAHAIGLALFRNQSPSNQNDIPVVAVLGDGECNEGLIWECLEFIGQLRLPNLIIFIDCNGWQQTQKSLYSHDQYKSLFERIRTYDVEAYKLNGHDHLEIYNSLNQPSNKTKIILGITIKGKGFPLFENNNNWHHGILTQSMYDELHG